MRKYKDIVIYKQKKNAKILFDNEILKYENESL